MNIKLTSEQEKLVEYALHSGHFMSVEEVIDEALRSLHDRKVGALTNARNGSQKEAVCEMLDFAEKNRISLEGTTVKQLIREGLLF